MFLVVPVSIIDGIILSEKTAFTTPSPSATVCIPAVNSGNRINTANIGSLGKMKGRRKSNKGALP